MSKNIGQSLFTPALAAGASVREIRVPFSFNLAIRKDNSQFEFFWQLLPQLSAWACTDTSNADAGSSQNSPVDGKMLFEVLDF